MMKASLLQVPVLIWLSLVTPAIAQTWKGPGEWLVPGGWKDGVLPTEEKAITFSPDAESGPILAPLSRCLSIDGPGVGAVDQKWSLEAGKLLIEEDWRWATSGTGKIRIAIDGAEISVGGEWAWGRGAECSGQVQFDSGSLNCRRMVMGPRGRLQMTSPAFLKVKESLTLGGGSGEGSAVLEMDGGLIKVAGSLVSGKVENEDPVPPLIVLRSGRLECGDCASFGGKITLEDGVLALRGDATSLLEGMMKEGRLTAYGLKEEALAIDYDPVRGETRVRSKRWVLAREPQPGDRTTDVDLSQTLSWEPSEYAIGHIVYFGTSLDQVTEGAKPYIRLDPGEPFSPILGFDQRYFWRVDGLDPESPEEPMEGPVWQFKTASGRASEPTPADNAKAVGLKGELAWVGGLAATGHEVYFGSNRKEVEQATSKEACCLGLIRDTRFPLPELKSGKTYFWRVDAVHEVHPDSPWKGKVWNFTVAAPE